MIKAMQARITTLEGSLSHKKNDANKTNEGGDRHTNLTCRKCKKKGHIAKNCPDKKEATEKKEGEADKESKKTGPTSPYKIPPKDSNPKTKKIEDVKCAWCDRCKRWTKGEKKHLTAQHKTKAELQQPAQANLASNVPVSSLQMMHFL